VLEYLQWFASGSEKILPFRQSLLNDLRAQFYGGQELSAAGEFPSVAIRKIFGEERKEL
jgi:hypothetical protein